MEFFNLVKNPVKVDKKAFLQAVNAGGPIAVTYRGEIVKGDRDTLPPKPYIYAGTPASLVGNAVTPPTPLSKVLGENYEVKDEGDAISIYAGRAWQELLDINEPFALYCDTTADGIAEFNDKELEDLIWYSCEFGLNYREVADHLEKSVEGLVLCIETQKPYNFNGCAFVDDIERAREEAKKFLKSAIEEKIKKGEVDRQNLSDEEEEALAFFGISA